MSDTELTEAAALLRTRASAATPGRWFQNATPRDAMVRTDGVDTSELHDEIAVTIDAADSDHIAAMDPDVTHAMADLLDAIATDVAPRPPLLKYDQPLPRAARTLARTYLRQTP